VIPDQYIVVFKDQSLEGKGINLQSLTHEARLDVVRQAAVSIADHINVPKENITATFGTALKGVVMKLNSQQLDALRKDRLVDFIEQDRWISLPKVDVAPATEIQAGKKGGTGSTGTGTTSTQTTPYGISVVGGPETPSTSITAWIVDSGIDLDHSDLNVVTSRCKNYVTSGTNTTTADDGHGHGTHVAGTVGAIDNNYGVVGVAPGINLVAMRVLNESGSGQWSWSISAFDHIAANGAEGDVVNYSVGAGKRYSSSSLDNAIKGMASAGIRVCIAAGNQGDDCSYYSPASVNATNVYTIGSMNSLKVWVSSSNYGTPVDWIEPGSSIKSTYKGNSYATMSGTSMATPHATGILAVGGIKSGGSATSVPSGTTTYYGVRD
jgi:subtilisin family serine protease